VLRFIQLQNKPFFSLLSNFFLLNLLNRFRPFSFCCFLWVLAFGLLSDGKIPIISRKDYKVPITTSGRILGIIWMFTAVIIISSFTANISSTLTVSRLQHNISSMKDLKKYKTGTVAGSRSAKYLLDKNFIYEEYTNAEVLLNALDSNIIEMAIYDAPVLNYYILNHKYSHTLELLPNKFNTDYYSYSLPKNHPLYSDINILLINELNTVAWQNILTEYDLNEN